MQTILVCIKIYEAVERGAEQYPSSLAVVYLNL